MKRVAVTGLGVVSALGPDAESFEAGLRAGRSGIAPADAVRQRRLPHDARRAGARAVAADRRRSAWPPRRAPIASACRRRSRPWPTPGSTRAALVDAAVVFGTGTGGLTSTEAFVQARRRPVVAAHRAPAGVGDRPGRAPPRRARPAHDHHDRLLVVGDGDRLRRRSHPPRPRRRRARRRRRGLDAARPTPASAACAPPRPATSRAARSTPSARGSRSAKAPPCWCSKTTSARARAARPSYAVVAGWGITADAHHMTAPHPEGDGAARAMLMALDDARPGRRRHRLRQRARHRHAAQRRRRDAGHQARARRARAVGAGVEHQVDGRPHARRRRRHRSGGVGAVAGARLRAADGAPAHARSGVRPRLHAGRGAPGRARGAAVELVRLRRQQHRPRLHARA